MSDHTTLDSKIEQRLKRANLITDDELSLVRELQKDSPLSIAEAIVELDLMSAAEVDAILDSLHEERSVKLSDVLIDIEAVRHVPRRVAWQYKCIPIRKSGNTLVMAVLGANIAKVREALRAVTDFEIVMLIADSDAIEHALFVHYGEDRPLECGLMEHRSTQQQTTNSWSMRAPWKTSFASFVEHEGVSHAKELAKQVASRGRDTFNIPIMLIGASGCGKTHLLEAIKNYFMAKDPLLKGILCTGEQLKTSIADFTACGSMDALRFDLRDCSILLVDDFGALFGKESCELEIADTILSLKNGGAAVVVTLGEEEYVQGPKSQKLRDVLSHGTEVRMVLPNPEAMRKIISERCLANYGADWRGFTGSESNATMSWHSFRQFVLESNSSLIQ